MIGVLPGPGPPSRSSGGTNCNWPSALQMRRLVSASIANAISRSAGPAMVSYRLTVGCARQSAGSSASKPRRVS